MMINAFKYIGKCYYTLTTFAKLPIPYHLSRTVLDYNREKIPSANRTLLEIPEMKKRCNLNTKRKG
jgi:hypothetical protein